MSLITMHVSRSGLSVAGAGSPSPFPWNFDDLPLSTSPQHKAVKAVTDEHVTMLLCLCASVSGSRSQLHSAPKDNSSPCNSCCTRMLQVGCLTSHGISDPMVLACLLHPSPSSQRISLLSEDISRHSPWESMHVPPAGKERHLPVPSFCVFCHVAGQLSSRCRPRPLVSAALAVSSCPMALVNRKTCRAICTGPKTFGKDMLYKIGIRGHDHVRERPRLFFSNNAIVTMPTSAGKGSQTGRSALEGLWTGIPWLPS